MTLTPEQVKIVNQESIIEALNAKLKETESDLKSLQTAHSLKGQKIVSLEAEIVRLRMLRTDEQLRAEVDGLREQVSKKDKEIDRLVKTLAKRDESEKTLLFRAQEAERRTAAFQATVETMQRARDEAQGTRDRIAADLQKALKEIGDLKEQAKVLATEMLELGRIRDATLKAVRALPPGSKKIREVRVLGALLKEPEPVEEKKEAAK